LSNKIFVSSFLPSFQLNKNGNCFKITNLLLQFSKKGIILFYVKFIKTVSGCSAMKAKDLAKKLGVSPATISLVLNNKPGISDSLRQSLLEKIEELGCQEMLCGPQSGAKGSREKSGKTAPPSIAYLIYTGCMEDDSNIAFFPAVLEGAEMEARDNGYNLTVLHMNSQGNIGLPELLRYNGNMVGAIVQAGQVSDRLLEDIKSLEVPCVLIDVYRPDLQLSSVCVNNEQGVFSLVKYLKEMGHREIGYVYSESSGESFQERKRCFHAALREFGLEDRPENYFISAWDCRDCSYDFKRITRQLSQAEHLPTVLVAEDDHEAAQIYQALRHLGLRVPEDISVTGFDDNFLATMLDPPLTTVKNYRHLMGRECVLLLQNLLRLKKAGIKNPCLKCEVSTRLVKRDSVRNLKESE